jgi:uncharacterized protein YggE
MGTLVAILTLAVPAVARAQAQASEPSVVVVSGEAVLHVAPDVAYVTVVAEARGRSPRQVQREAADAMAAVQGKLTQAGVAAGAIKTTSFSVNPEFDWVQGRQVLRGYVARHEIELRVDALDRTGELIDLAVGSGATSLGSLRFDLKDRQAVERDALQAAVADALARAKAAAAGAGRTVERVLRVEEPGAIDVRPVPTFAARSAEVQAPTPIVAGAIEIQARVRLTAAIK